MVRLLEFKDQSSAQYAGSAVHCSITTGKSLSERYLRRLECARWTESGSARSGVVGCLSDSSYRWSLCESTLSPRLPHYYPITKLGPHSTAST